MNVTLVCSKPVVSVSSMLHCSNWVRFANPHDARELGVSTQLGLLHSRKKRYILAAVQSVEGGSNYDIGEATAH